GGRERRVLWEMKCSILEMRAVRLSSAEVKESKAYALLEGLGSKGQKATVERLNEYLQYRVRELAEKQGKRQTPRIMADPIEKSHLILMPKYATKIDISTLKNDAYKAQINKYFKRAERHLTRMPGRFWVQESSNRCIATWGS
ncbi:MAG: hypothetical protein ACP5D7_12350, partial [Limnospira sp.]